MAQSSVATLCYSYLWVVFVCPPVLDDTLFDGRGFSFSSFYFPGTELHSSHLVYQSTE